MHSLHLNERCFAPASTLLVQPLLKGSHFCRVQTWGERVYLFSLAPKSTFSNEFKLVMHNRLFSHVAFLPGFVVADFFCLPMAKKIDCHSFLWLTFSVNAHTLSLPFFYVTFPQYNKMMTGPFTSSCQSRGGRRRVFRHHPYRSNIHCDPWRCVTSR